MVASSAVKQRTRVYTKRRLPPAKTLVAAALMLIAGLNLLIVGTVLGWYKDRERGMTLMVLGALLFIPGSYTSTLLFGAYRNWPGYSYESVPSYDQ